MRVRPLITLVALAIGGPISVSAEVIINEVMFDPGGSDTGGEWVELYNSGESTDLSNWQIYPDGIGYFTFPAGASIPAGGFLVVRLRTSGDNTPNLFFHPDATANMGNSAGSLALFSAGTRGKDTLRSFVRYYKPSSGSAEKKTWETTAVEKGMWQAGSFVNIDALEEGSAIARDGATPFAASWQIAKEPTFGASNAAPLPGGGQATTTEVSSTSPQRLNTVHSLEMPRLYLEILAAPDGVVGAPHRLVARVVGVEKQLLEGGVRYVWNFGDGSVGEGPARTHAFKFPAEYSVSVTAYSGSAIGSASALISVKENPIEISEVSLRQDGFIEFRNRSSAPIDMTGWVLAAGTSSMFTFPEQTVVRPRAFFVLPHEHSGIYPALLNGVTLRFANMAQADSFAISSPTAGASYERSGNGWKAGIESPGSAAAEGSDGEVSEFASSVSPRGAALASSAAANENSQTLPRVLTDEAPQGDALLSESPPQGAPSEGKAAGRSRWTPQTLLIGAGLISVMFGIIVVVLRRKLV